MGRRSRKRTADLSAPAIVRDPGAAVPARAPSAPRRRARSEDRPPAPWGGAPLTELATLIGLVLLVVGFAARSTPVLVAGFGLVALFAVELAVREHMAGFRSHTTLLAGAAAMSATAPLVALGAARAAQLAVILVVFAVVFAALRRAFTRRSGGLGFRA